MPRARPMRHLGDLQFQTGTVIISVNNQQGGLGSPRVSRFSWRRDGPWDRGDTPVTSGLWILTREEDSIDRSFTVLVRVIRRCLPAPPHRARWPVCWPCSGRALPPRHSPHSSAWSLV